MKIIYDYQAFTSIASGASRSFCEIALRISDGINDAKIVSLYSNNIFLKELFYYEKPFLPYFSFKGKSKVRDLIEVLYSCYKLKLLDYDLLHATGEDTYFEEVLNKPYVVTIHDMIPENLLNDNNRIRKRKKQLQGAARIICVSENTKKELLNLYSFVDPAKVDVVYHGISRNEYRNLPVNFQNYILFVGERNGYKNFHFSIEALAPYLRKNKDLNIVCTGRAFTKDEIRLFNRCKIADQVISAGYISNQLLYSLYNSALVFLYPSRYEGFGIPIIEAMINDCPICISNSSCFPEIAGDCASYFDPYSKESILESVVKVIENTSYAKSLIFKGKDRVLDFTWEKSKNMMLNSYKKAII